MTHSPSTVLTGSSGRALFAAFVLSAIINCPAAFGQEGAPADDPAAMAEQALAAPEPAAAENAEAAGPVVMPAITDRLNLWDLLVSGGMLMIPIGLISLLVVTFGIERTLGLRRRKVLPPSLVDGLGLLASQKSGLDPRQAYRLCQQHPSAAANVIRAMLQKVGRPHSELEHAVKEASQREAERLYGNVRWLNLSASIAPLLGLLGTVWGMIIAFFTTANLPTGVNRAQFLAHGIYVALVTTLAGLSVAIPASVLAHLFEGRIQKLFRQLDEMISGLLPQLERFEGRLRISGDKVVEPPPPPVGHSDTPTVRHISSK